MTVLDIAAKHLGNYINGAWLQAHDGATRENINPADTTDVIGQFAESDAADTASAVDAATAASAEWAELGPISRAGVLRRAIRIIEEREEIFAEVITREQGKRLGEARGEVSRALAILDFTAGEGRRLDGITTPTEDPRTLAMTFRRPIGTVGLITPWNFPLAIPMWKVAPAMLSGCTAVLKPSPLTPLTSALLVQAFADAGVPPGVLNLVQGDRPVGEGLVAHPRVAGISFTGSLAVGRAIQQAGATRLLRTQLELGGKNALIVLGDADLDKATDAITHGAFGQAGQRCSATSRVIVDAPVKEELLERIRQRVAAMTVGPGTREDVDIGPVVNKERMYTCLAAIENAQAAGAKVTCGGQAATGLPPGYFIEPTVLRDVPWDSEIAQEEIFGPVLSVIDCDGFDDAIRIANSVRYGMSGTIFTQDPSRMFEALERLEAGMLHVNRPGVGAYAHLPHMGTKDSQSGPPECSPDVWNFYTDLVSACLSYLPSKAPRDSMLGELNDPSNGTSPRRAVRVVCVTDTARILLIRWQITDRPYWEPPGGGIDAGETPLAAARRELAEETGLTADLVLDRPVPVRRDFAWFGHPDPRTEEFFLARLRRSAPSIVTQGLTEAERSWYRGYDWFTPDEIATLDEHVEPPDLLDVIDMLTRP